MKYLLVLSLFMVGCSEPTASHKYRNPEHREKCNIKCQEKFGTDVDKIGDYAGTCFCK